MRTAVGGSRTEDDPVIQLGECRAALRAMALELSRAQDEERARIARDLHDDLGQTLVAVQLRLAEFDGSGSPDIQREFVGEVSDLLRETIDSVRTLTFELRAPVLPELGIDFELEHLATDLTEKFGIPCRFDSDSAPKPLSPEVAVTLLRVCRELVHNIIKHSRAHKAELDVQRARDRILITISDDGIGFPPRAPSAPERMGFGLLIISERLAEIGGEMELRSSTGTGTRAVVAAPLLTEA